MSVPAISLIMTIFRSCDQFKDCFVHDFKCEEMFSKSIVKGVQNEYSAVKVTSLKMPNINLI